MDQGDMWDKLDIGKDGNNHVKKCVKLGDGDAEKDKTARPNQPGDYSFSTMIFHDFSTTKIWFPWPIGTVYFFKIHDTRLMNAYQNKNISSCSS